MNMPDEHIRQAYIDGELSVGEMTNYEKTLSPEELKLLTSEKQFDGAVSDHLAQNAACPMEVWERTKALLQSPPSNVTEFAGLKKRRLPSMYWGFGSLVAAACVAFVVVNIAPGITPGGDDSVKGFLSVGAETVGQLAAQAETSPTQDAVEELLHSHEILVQLNEMPELPIYEIHYGMEYLGAKTNTSVKEVVELLFACCEHPVKVVVAKRDSEAAKIIGQAVASNKEVQGTRIINEEYVAVVVASHPANGFMEVFANQHP
jgi:hypothetical protein